MSKSLLLVQVWECLMKIDLVLLHMLYKNVFARIIEIKLISNTQGLMNNDDQDDDDPWIRRRGSGDMEPSKRWWRSNDNLSSTMDTSASLARKIRDTLNQVKDDDEDEDLDFVIHTTPLFYYIFLNFFLNHKIACNFEY